MATKQAPFKPDMKHWLFQIIPPLSILGILFGTDNGTTLVFLAGIFVIPFLISLISIFAKAFRFNKSKYFMIRPALTVIFFFLILAIAQWTYKLALDDAVAAAKTIHDECNQFGSCPATPEGWEINDSRIRRTDLGFWFKYQASYIYKSDSFKIHVYQGPDIGYDIIGGVNMPFKVARYIEEY